MPLSDRSEPIQLDLRKVSRKLLLVTDSLEIGGAERHVVDLAIALSEGGHHVRVACSQGGRLEDALHEAEVPVHVVMSQLVKRRISETYAGRLTAIVWDWAPDLIHAHVHASANAAAIAARETGTPLIVTEHTEGWWKDPAAQREGRLAYSLSRHIIAVSRPIQSRLIESEHIPRARVTCIPNAVRRAPFPLNSPIQTGPGSPIVGVVARLQPEKGLFVFLDAVARVAPQLPQTRFILVGDGPMRDALRARVRHLGVDSRIRFLVSSGDARALLPSFDLLVVPSLTEGSPLITLEAMAAGVPILATCVGGIPDQIHHEREGLLVPPSDPEALADGMCRILADRTLAKRLAVAGRCRVESEFRHEDMVRRIEVVYRAVLALEPMLAG